MSKFKGLTPMMSVICSLLFGTDVPPKAAKIWIITMARFARNNPKIDRPTFQSSIQVLGGEMAQRSGNSLDTGIDTKAPTL
jgi:hypothetical protein